MRSAYKFLEYEENVLSLNIDLNLITIMPVAVNNIKSVQYLLIVKAGLAVMEGSEKSSESLFAEAMSQFAKASSGRINVTPWQPALEIINISGI